MATGHKRYFLFSGRCWSVKSQYYERVKAEIELTGIVPSSQLANVKELSYRPKGYAGLEVLVKREQNGG